MCGRLLLVDDERAILTAMNSYFRAKGYSVDCAAAADEARNLLTSGRYDCVILDLKLTPQDTAGGLEIVPVARQHNPAARLIVLTAYGSARVEAEARRHGVDAFLHKPQALGDLEQIVASLTHKEA